jgi:hypothetical protein
MSGLCSGKDMVQLSPNLISFPMFSLACSCLKTIGLQNQVTSEKSGFFSFYKAFKKNSLRD